jgi:hypothetical protein
MGHSHTGGDGKDTKTEQFEFEEYIELKRSRSGNRYIVRSITNRQFNRSYFFNYEIVKDHFVLMQKDLKGNEKNIDVAHSLEEVEEKLYAHAKNFAENRAKDLGNISFKNLVEKSQKQTSLDLKFN